MTAIILKPGHPAAFFKALAQIDEHLLLQAASTLGMRQDFVSMHGLLDFMESPESDLFLLYKTRGEDILVPAQPDSTDCFQKDPHATLVRALVLPLQPPCISQVDQHDAINQVTSYAQRLAIVLKGLPEDVRQKSLDLALFEASVMVREGVVLQALIQAGANPLATFTTRGKENYSHDLKGEATPFIEALRHANYGAALAIGQHMDKGWMHHTLTSAILDNRGQYLMPLSLAFQPIVWPMVQTLACEDNLEPLKKLLAFMTQQYLANEVDSKKENATDALLYFHASLLAGYCYEKKEKSPTAWTQASLSVAAGPGGLETNSKLAEWLAERFSQNPQPSDVIVLLTNLALHIHCPPVLALCQPVLHGAAPCKSTKATQTHEAEFGKKYDLGFSTAVFNIATEPRFLSNLTSRAPTDPYRFRETIAMLTKAGYDINAPFVLTNRYQHDGRKDHTVLRVCAGDTLAEMRVKLPILLEFGADSSRPQKNNQTLDGAIRDNIKDTDKFDVWSQTVDSFRARQAALAALNAISDFESEATEKSIMHL